MKSFMNIKETINVWSAYVIGTSGTTIEPETPHANEMINTSTLTTCNTDNNMMNIFDLYDDAWLTICFFLNYQELALIHQTCHYFRKLTNPKSPLFSKYFETQSRNLLPDIEPSYYYTPDSWFEFFIETIQFNKKLIHRLGYSSFTAINKFSRVNIACSHDYCHILAMYLSNPINHIAFSYTDLKCFIHRNDEFGHYHDKDIDILPPQLYNLIIGDNLNDIKMDELQLSKLSNTVTSIMLNDEFEKNENNDSDYDSDECNKTEIETWNLVQNGDLLIKACNSCSYNSFKYLITTFGDTIDMNCKLNTFGKSALESVIIKHYKYKQLQTHEMRNLLIKNHSSLTPNIINATFSDKLRYPTIACNLLHFVTIDTDVELIRYLGDKGANLLDTNDRFETPLVVACKRESCEAIKTLFEIAAKPNYNGVGKRILEQAIIDDIHGRHESIIFWATKQKNGHVKMQQILKYAIELKLINKSKNEHKTLAEQPNGQGITPLAMAVFNNYLDAIKCLFFEFNVNPNAVVATTVCI